MLCEQYLCFISSSTSQINSSNTSSPRQCMAVFHAVILSCTPKLYNSTIMTCLKINICNIIKLDHALLALLGFFWIMNCPSSESVVLKDGFMGCVISNAIARPWGVTVLVWVCRDGYRGLQALAISHRWGFQMVIVRVLHNTCYHFIALVGEGRSPRNPGTGPLKDSTGAADDDHDSHQTPGNCVWVSNQDPC